MTEEPTRPDRRQPVDVSLDGRQLQAIMAEAGIDLNDVERSRELLRNAGADLSEIRLLDSRLQMARAVDWEVDVTVTVRY
jgi:hypothetical protein